MLGVQVKAVDFFLGYRKVALEPHEVLLRVSIPFQNKNEYVREFKQAHRRDDDIAIVNAGMRVQMARAMSGESSESAAPAVACACMHASVQPCLVKARKCGPFTP